MRLFRRLVALAAGACLFANTTQARSESRNPLNYLSILENPRIQTPSHRVHAFSDFDLTFDLHKAEQRVKLSLEPNHDILPEGAQVEFLRPDGEVLRTERIDRAGHRIFKGQAWILGADGSWTHVGTSRIVIRRDGVDPLFEGMFNIHGDHHHIQFRTNFMQTKHQLDPELESYEDEYMVVFRDSDIGRKPQGQAHGELKRSLADRSCQADKLQFNADPRHPLFQQVLKRDAGVWGSMSANSLFGKRQIDGSGVPTGGNSAGVNLASTIGNTAGCPTTRKVALVGVTTDCGYTGSFNSSESAYSNVITQVNSASDLYEKTFNITLGLQNLTVSDASCPGVAPASTPWNLPCSDNQTITDRLNLFSAWRGQRGNDSNAYWSLFSTCNTGAEIGLAWLGQLCNTGVTTGSDTDGSTESVTGANVVVRTSTEWQVFAHETGHIFGAVHDCDSQTCSDGTTVKAQQCCPLSTGTCDANAQYIMNPSSGPGITGFSPCTVGNICSAMSRNSVKSSCLADNKGLTTVSRQQCGNGIVEAGEDCDCGGTESCASDSCCDPTTCKFKGNAVCDDSNEDCCRNCQFASAGTVCRSSTGQCDPQETCSGTNATCPPDLTSPDGQGCGNSSQHLQCASGQCTSRDQQCKTLMGSFTQNNDTYACNSQTCSLSCASPEFGAGVCYSMQQNFLDGTNCGGGGKCQNGKCSGSSVTKEVGSWINDNKPLVIGLCCAVGGVILLAILGCIIRRCCHGSRRPRKRGGRSSRSSRRGGSSKQHAPGWDGPRSWGGSGWDGPPPPQHQFPPQPFMQQQGGWGGPPAMPPPPPPYMTGGAQRGPSVRYA